VDDYGFLWVDLVASQGSKAKKMKRGDAKAQAKAVGAKKLEGKKAGTKKAAPARKTKARKPRAKAARGKR
jgi:hypothetical protein